MKNKKDRRDKKRDRYKGINTESTEGRRGSFEYSILITNIATKTPKQTTHTIHVILTNKGAGLDNVVDVIVRRRPVRVIKAGVNIIHNEKEGKSP